jgi:hypothetical protein
MKPSWQAMATKGQGKMAGGYGLEELYHAEDCHGQDFCIQIYRSFGTLSTAIYL